jgi:hypothetical protein
MTTLERHPSSEFVTLVDFDWTLSNTTMSSDDLWYLMAERGDTTYEQAKIDGVAAHVDKRGGYMFEKHIAKYGLDSVQMWKELDDLVRSHNYLYDDAIEFIQELLTAGMAPEILTFGEDRFQRAKIVPILGKLSAGISEEMHIQTVMEPKGMYIARTYPGKRGVLVDDKDEQALPEGWTEIFLDRKVELDEPLKRTTGFQVYNLHQAAQVIKNL